MYLYKDSELFSRGSLRTASNGGSIGSLDTVATSEGSGSTVVTHASDATSYSASSANSQTASTRGVCGSLASFDTLSMQNNEGNIYFNQYFACISPFFFANSCFF